MSDTIQIALIEDHPEYRETIELVLKRAKDLNLIGAFGSSERALNSFQDKAAGLCPDLVLLDLGLPGMSGIEAIPEILTTLPNARIIVLTQSDRDSDVLAAIENGASGYLLKSSTARQITDSIRSVSEGGASLDPAIATYIVNSLKGSRPTEELTVSLSPREQEVLTLLASGLAKKEIADRLGIGESTVVTHVSHVYSKLEVQNAPAAVAKAFRTGLLKLED